MSYIKNNFAELLDAGMKKVGLTDEELAVHISVSKMTIYNWRTGKIKHPNSRDKVLDCAEALQLTPKQCAELLQAAGHCPGKNQAIQPPVPVVGVPICLPYQFFGRENILRQIYWAWHKTVPESIVVIGPIRSGKTSLLNYLNYITQAVYLRPNQPKGWPFDWLPCHFQFVLVDFQDVSLYQPETLIKEVLLQLKLKVPTPCNLASFSNVLKRVKQPTIMLMDNIEVGFNIPTLDAAFWQNMRFLGNQGKLSFVITTTESLEKLARDFVHPVSFFDIFGHTLELEALTECEARELLASSPKTFSEEEIEGMLKESGCWPAPLQKLCDRRLQALLL